MTGSSQEVRGRKGRKVGCDVQVYATPHSKGGRRRRLKCEGGDGGWWERPGRVSRTVASEGGNMMGTLNEGGRKSG